MTPTRTPVRRINHTARRQVLFMLAGLAVVWIITLILMSQSKITSTSSARYLGQLRRLQNANAEAEANAAFGIADHRFLVLERGDGQKAPGVVDPEDRARYGVRVIPMPLDLPVGKEEQDRLAHVAFDYAYHYNVALLKKLHPVEKPVTAPSGQGPTTQHSATQPTTRR